MDRRGYLRWLGVGSLLTAAGCADDSGADSGPGDETGSDGADGADSSADAGGPLTLATATTAHDSGLLGAVNPGFERAFDVSVRTVVRGTGGALQTARAGDCDVVLVHARPLEDQFLREGHGINRRSVMVNDFLVVGPPDDPADAAGRDPVAAFRAIADAEARFLSRGDRSGTNIREREIWDAAGTDPGGSWYSETGQGMGNTLVMAQQSGAYTLTDRGTFRTVIDDDELVAHVDRGIADPPPLLRNEYAVIPTNPARHEVNYPLAMAYAGYLTGPGRERIRAFRVRGERVFRPLGSAPEPDFQQYVPADGDCSLGGTRQ
jgi:tungstate transport system substrate-binding protein